jgi:type VI secretion system protein ImpE
MNASELFKAGRLPEAVDAQLKVVKADPADHGKRLFLFEMLAFSGDLERAGRQIEVINYGELERDKAVMDYRKLLDAEKARRRLFSEGLSPQLFGEKEPPEHVRLRLEAVQCLRNKQPAEARELLDRANSTPPLKGELNDKAFALLRDADDLFGGVLEVMTQGNYYWVPLEQLETLTIKAPQFPRDLLWLPAHLSLRDGAAGPVFLPTLYPGSHEHGDNQVKLGRLTDWKSQDAGPTLGVGLHTFLVDDGGQTLLEWRQLTVAAETAEGI